MKKINYIAALIVLLAMPGIASAQVSGGIKAGLNICNQKSSLGGESESYTGTSFHFGAFLEVPMGDDFTFQPEVLYNSFKISDSGEDLTLNFLSVPLMFQYWVVAERFNFQFGPQVNFLLSTDPGVAKDLDVYKSSGFAFNFGVGAAVKQVTFTGRYSLGLSDMTGSGAEDIFGDDLEIKQGMFQLSIGYKFPH
jgi:hypothetical protein